MPLGLLGFFANHYPLITIHRLVTLVRDACPSRFPSLLLHSPLKDEGELSTARSIARHFSHLEALCNLRYFDL
jgi:hypothetical protein